LSTKSFEIEEIGLITVTRRRGSKRISMRIGSDGKVKVNHPWFASQSEVIRFVLSNIDWIKTHQQKVTTRRTIYQFDEEIKTKNHTISILQAETGKIRAGISGGKVVIAIPSSMNIEHDEVQEFIKKVIVRICRKDAKVYLPERVKELAVLYGFKYQQVYIKNLKSKWGSCSSVGNINLNLSLMLQPDHLIDYIILHELAHTKEHNHGAGFWQLLNEITDGKAKELDKEIKKSRLI